jgi:hypothetical protein
LQAEDVSTSDSLKFVHALVAEIGQLGHVSEATVQKMETLAPKFTESFLNAAKRIEPGSVETGDISAKLTAKILIDPQFIKDQQQAAADAAKQLSEIGPAWDNLTAAAKRLAEAVSGGHVIAETLHGLELIINDITDQIEKLQKLLSEKQKTGAAAGAGAGAAIGLATLVSAGFIPGAFFCGGVGVLG